ncbi:MAG: hypothetical protein ACI9VO_002085, partial [Colwellia sp.]
EITLFDGTSVSLQYLAVVLVATEATDLVTYFSP